MAVRTQRRLSLAKATSYEINSVRDRPGTTFMNSEAGGSPVTFLLPPPAQGLWGESYRFRSIVDQPIVIGVQNNECTFITLGDTDAPTVSLPTVGGLIEVECIRTPDGRFRWFAASWQAQTPFTEEITINGERVRPKPIAVNPNSGNTELAWEFYVEGRGWQPQSSREISS